jgi:hypothetical protein
MQGAASSRNPRRYLPTLLNSPSKNVFMKSCKCFFLITMFFVKELPTSTSRTPTILSCAPNTLPSCTPTSDSWRDSWPSSRTSSRLVINSCSTSPSCGQRMLHVRPPQTDGETAGHQAGLPQEAAALAPDVGSVCLHVRIPLTAGETAGHQEGLLFQG